MPHKQFKVKSPQQWKRSSVRTTPRRSEQKTTHSIRSAFSKKQLKRFWIKRIVGIGVTLVFIAIITGSVTVAWFTRYLPQPGGIIERDIPLSTKIYDRTGETLLYEIYSDQKRTPVRLSEIPQYVKWATIIAEDRTFYSHAGFKFTSIIRSVVINVLRGGRVQGGSTITQQLIKNAFLNSEKSYTRKIKELILAWQLERKFTKDEILELYFNEIPYGSTAYGIESAAQAYFGVNAQSLTIAQAAVLAALPKAPSYYSPYGSHYEELIARQRFIINSMESEGYISTAEAQKAHEELLEFRPITNHITAPHFVFYVKQLLSEKYGERVVEQGGLSVITSLDLFKQSIAEKIITERGEINERQFNATNAALVAIDPKTGEIITLVGSRDFFNKNIDGEVNVALRPRQPGSSFKPIVYAAAFEYGLSPETILFDLNTIFKTVVGDYEPKNYNLKEHGPVSIRDALGSSLNIPAVKVLYLTGIDRVLNLANNLGYTTLYDRSRFGLSLVLGGAEVTLLEHTAAYATFAREGLYRKPTAILKVTNKDGKILEEFKPDNIKPKKVLDAQIVRNINSILSDNYARLLTFNENNHLNLGDRPVAAKTGTTNDFRDAWTLGYTPSLAVGVWVGNNNNTQMGEKSAGGSIAAPIWNLFMKQVLGNTPYEEFKQPEQMPLPNKPMLNGELALKKIIKIDTTSGKLATDYTPRADIIEKTYMEVHNILHYVNKNNPLGPTPENPWGDENYTPWELPVEKWAQENNIITGNAPTEFDTAHTKEDEPELFLSYPNTHEIITNNQLNVLFSTSAKRGIYAAELYIDNALIAKQKLEGQKNINDYMVSTIIPNTLNNGNHFLKLVVYDDQRNDREVIIPITITLPNNPHTTNIINFDTPHDNEFISPASFPYTFFITVSEPETLQKIDFYLQDSRDYSSELVASITELKPSLSVTINSAPDLGTYTLYTITTNSNNTLSLDRDVTIIVQ